MKFGFLLYHICCNNVIFLAPFSALCIHIVCSFIHSDHTHNDSNLQQVIVYVSGHMSSDQSDASKRMH